MDIEIVDLDTGKYYSIPILIEDFEVDIIWGLREAIENEESTDIEVKEHWDNKQRAAADFKKNKVKIAVSVYLTCYEKYSVLVNRKNGKVYHFNNHEFVLEIIGPEEFWLRKITTNERQCIYKNGIFFPTKGDWLIESSGSLSSGKCRGIQMHSDLYGDIKIKNHQIVAAMFIGQKAIELAIAEKAQFDINHRNLDNSDNRPENLEIVTKRRNKEHAGILRKYIKEKLEQEVRKLGITNYKKN